MPSTLGATLRRLRLAADLTQETLAARVGVKQSVYSKWERGRAIPETLSLLRLASAFKVAVDELAVGIDPGYDRFRADLLRQGLSPNLRLESEETNAPLEDRLRVAEQRAAKAEARLESLKTVAADLLEKLGTANAREVDGAQEGKPKHRRRA